MKYFQTQDETQKIHCGRADNFHFAGSPCSVADFFPVERQKLDVCK